MRAMSRDCECSRFNAEEDGDAQDYVQRSHGTFHWHTGRIPILFGWRISSMLLVLLSFIAAASGRSHAGNQLASHSSWPHISRKGGRDDVEVLYGTDRDGIRSQSISFADLNVGSERFPRQLDTVHDHLMWRRGPEGSPDDVGEERWPLKTFDSDYDRFINEHFRQNYELYRPESESEQMARDHERFRELPHYQQYEPQQQRNRKLHPEVSSPTTFARHRPRQFKVQSDRREERRPTIQEDVEDYQANDETLDARGHHSHPDGYERIKQLSTQQPKNQRLCKAAQRGEMLCQVCLNPKTGAKSESCSYASKPHSTKYAYAKAHSYANKKDDVSSEEEDDDDDEDEELGTGNEHDGVGDNDGEDDEERPEIHTNLPLRKRNQSRTARRPRIKRQAKAKAAVGRWRRRKGRRVVVEEEAQSVKELLPQMMEAERAKKDEDVAARRGDVGEDGDFSSGVFAEFRKFQGGDVNEDATAREGTQQRKDMERTLADFRMRDWKDCKRTRKQEMTCYECEDGHGGQHEECVFVWAALEEQKKKADEGSSGAVPRAPQNNTERVWQQEESGTHLSWHTNSSGQRGGEVKPLARAEDCGIAASESILDSSASFSSLDIFEKQQPQRLRENVAEQSDALILLLPENNPRSTSRSGGGGKNNSVPVKGDDDYGGGGGLLISNKSHLNDKGVSGVGKKKHHVKLNRKLVIKKRILKQQPSDYLDDVAGTATHLLPHRDTSAVKKTIRKKVTYRKSAKKRQQAPHKDPGKTSNGFANHFPAANGNAVVAEKENFDA